MKRIILISLWFLSFSSLLGWFPVYAEDRGIRHELTSEIRWITDEYTYDDYVVNGEALPTVAGNLDAAYVTLTGSYTFFLTPLPIEQGMPMALQRFVLHPSAMTVNFSFQPESTTTYIYQNLENQYQLHREQDEQSRGAGLNVIYYVWRNIGLSFRLSSSRFEKAVRTADTLNQQGTGEQDEIRRDYGVGVSYYPLNHVKLSVLYTGFDWEYQGSEQIEKDDKSFIPTKNVSYTDTNGKQLTVTGEYIFRNILGIQGFYEFWDQDAHAKTSTLYYEEIPGAMSYYDADTLTRTLGTTVSLYLGEKTTVRTGGSYTLQQVDRTYHTDQIVELDWQITRLDFGLSYDINRYIGMQIGYEWATRNSDVVTRYPASASDLRTTYHAKARFHAWYIGVTGRF